MNISGIDLNLMGVFEAMMAEKHVSRAAQKVGLSQPAMSAALSRLRALYKDPLFVRSPKGMMPTHKAKQLEEPISKALDLLRGSLAAEPEFDPKTCDKTFRIAMSDWLCLLLLPKISAFLRKEAPLSNLSIRNMASQEMHQALMNGELDLGISGQPNTGSGKYRQVLYREHYECIVWSGHSAIKNKLTLKDYVHFPHVLFSPQGSGAGAVDKVLAKKGLKRRVGMRVIYSLVIPAIIQHTDLIATVPAPLARFFAPYLNVKVFSPPIPLPEHDMTQYWGKESHTDPAHRWFRGVLMDICREFQK